MALPTSKLKRNGVITKTLLKVGVVHTKEKLKERFFSAYDGDKRDEHIAKIVMESLGELKSVSVKIAQQIILVMPFLPKAYTDELSKTFHQVPPINRALMRKMIKQELGNYPEEAFDRFDPVPIGSASLGQVHQAYLGEEKVAIKVQYPGIAKTIHHDLSLVKSGIKRFAKGESIDPLMHEITVRLEEEVDYDKEAENLHFFHQAITHPSIHIPKLVPDYSTKRLLVTSFVKGKTFDAYLASSPSQESRNHYAQLLFHALSSQKDTRRPKSREFSFHGKR